LCRHHQSYHTSDVSFQQAEILDFRFKISDSTNQQSEIVNRQSSISNRQSIIRAGYVCEDWKPGGDGGAQANPAGIRSEQMSNIAKCETKKQRQRGENGHCTTKYSASQ
jgi:hypothetical protein